MYCFLFCFYFVLILLVAFVLFCFEKVVFETFFGECVSYILCLRVLDHNWAILRFVASAVVADDLDVRVRTGRN